MQWSARRKAAGRSVSDCKPVVISDERGNESLAIHSLGLLTLSWDHRAFDGAYAAAFMQRLREVLETRDWMSEL